ncbi:MAG TPA: alpha/beta hydrolase [Candidatus Binataceae bacterium]
MPIVKAGAVSLSYDTFGAGPPLLLIMGFGAPGIAWMPVLPMLSGFKCIYFDNRGTGNSEKPAGPYTVPDMADDAADLLGALGIESAMVYGISMGGMIAQELALRHPGRVSKMVLGCTTTGGPASIPPAEETIASLLSAMKLMPTDPERAIDMLLPVVHPPDFVAAHPEIKQMALMGAAMMPPTPADVIERTLEGITRFNSYDRLPEVRCPVLIVHGERDILIKPANAELLKSRLPQAEVFMIPNAGHNFFAENSMGIHQRIVEFLKQ